MTIKKKYRIKLKKDFEKVFQKGVYVKKGPISLKFSDNNLDYSRFSVIVGKKISKKAVLRNKLKRKIKEIIRKNIDYIKKGKDIIIFPSTYLKDLDYYNLEKILIDLFKKANLFLKTKNDRNNF